MSLWKIERLLQLTDEHIQGLSDVLVDCVEGGDSVSFMSPLTRERAELFWKKVAQGVAAGERALLVARDGEGICGTVQLILDLPENQPHRADLCKMLVHRRARRQGLGAALMQAAESLARDCGKSLLVLDAVTNGDAARLYERLGWVRVGDVPHFAFMPDGAPCNTTYYYRNLNEPVVTEACKTTPSTTNVVVDMHIREATEADLPAIVDIYNQSIPAGWSTADTKPITVADRVGWFRKFDSAMRPIWVGEVDGQVVAMSYLSSFYGGRPAYDATAEASIYVATAWRRRGIGRRLKQWVIEQCPRLGVTTLLSMHFDHNEGTRRINESLGFERMGHLTEIAMVQGRKRGLVIWGLRIPARTVIEP
jgi:L-amino acid N-acyltransferase YncA